LALTEGIKINQNIRVTRTEGEEDWYISDIQDIGKHDISISIPTKGSNPLVLNSGDLVKISLVSETSRIEFKTKVVEWRFDNIPLYALALPKDFKRVQLRDYVRIPIILEVNYADLPDPGQKPVFIKCNSLDLSGGGIRLLLQKEYPADTSLLLKITIPLPARQEELEVVGRVVRSWPDQNVKLYQTALQFIKISRKQQDLIIRFILTKMSERRRLS